MNNIMKWVGVLTLVLTSMVGSWATASAQEGVEATPDRAQTAEVKNDEIRVRVTNQNLRELRVYVVGGPVGSPLDSRISLGTVSALGSRSFTLRDSLVRGAGGQFRILVRPVGQREYLASEHFAVGAGSTVEWTLTRPLWNGGYLSITD